ncbi:caveolin-2-like [Anguilla anguilla]|uniref:caveolin-2-like n=1 Tax=Anguilla anguilla TaxID=7936 RepID=UPI0015B2461A|nr:caveolin-2-like [Anguilla anguilla]
MGFENEKSETSIILDEDEFNRSVEPILNKKDKVFTETPDRDPQDTNGNLKVSFEDVVGEPGTAHSFDKVWIGSHAVFELVKYVLYRLLTTVLAIPLSFVAGVAFAVLSCVHIWVAMPAIRSLLMVLPPLRTVWQSLTDRFIAPLFHSAGACLSAVDAKVLEN